MKRPLAKPPATRYRTCSTRRAQPDYEKARFEWNDRYASLAKGKRNWQIVGLVLLVVNIALSSALVWTSTQTRITPFVVEVDQFGQAVAFGPAEKLRKTDERLIRYLLSLYLHNARTVIADAKAQRHLLDSVYAFSRGNAKSLLNAHFAEENPFERALRETVRVQVQSILPVADDTWQVQWVETSYNALGRAAKTSNFQAVLTVELEPPKTTQSILTNPLGLFVTDLTWTETL